MSDRFDRAMKALTGEESRHVNLSQPFVDVLPIHGASVSTLGRFLGNETVSATDDQAARIDELQFDLGEGPCWDAMSTSAPVLEPDIRNRPVGVWPAFSEAIRAQGVGAIFAFPMVVGPLQLGAVDLYCSSPQTLSSTDTQRSEALALVVGRLVLRHALTQLDQPESLESASPFFRRTLHQATGMVLAQLNIPPDDARLVIQAHAFATGRSVHEVSEDILNRRLDFSVSDGSPGGSND
jgi:hypothetical protein